MDNLKLNEKITLLRNRQKISQTLLSERTGIHLGTISKYENGHMQPSIDALIKIAKALETSTDYLLFDDYQEKKATTITNDQWLKLAENVDSLSKTDQKYIFDLVKGYLERHFGDFPKQKNALA